MARRTLQHELGKKRPFDDPSQEAYLNIVRSASLLSADLDRLLKRHRLSGATYNVLRILRGAGEGGRKCCEVGAHMVTRVPDVTRLVDRLVRLGLATRRRCDADRRIVYVGVTPKGLGLLARLDEPVLASHRSRLGHIPARDLRRLSDLLVSARRTLVDEQDEGAGDEPARPTRARRAGGSRTPNGGIA